MGEPLTLADGTVIDTATGRPVRKDRALPGFVEVPTHTEAKREVIKVRKRLADLPDVPEKMNIIAVVASYYMFGLDDYEIAHALGCSERQVGNIKLTEAFGQLVETMTKNIAETEAEDVRALINNEARNAVGTLREALQSEDEKVAVVAAKDILDRAGHRPADIIEHRHRIEGGLVIEYVSKGAKDDAPVLDLNAEDVTDVG